MPVIDPGDDLKEQQRKLVPDGSWVWLLKCELSASETVYLAANIADVSFLSNTYRAYPFTISGIQESSDGEFTRMTVTISDPAGVIASVARQNNDLSDATVTIYKVSSDLVSTPTDGGGKKNYLTWVAEVENISYPRDGVVASLSGGSILRLAAPIGLITRDACPYVFKDSATCQYSGSGTFCDKTLDGPSGCLFYDNVINYGGWADVPKVAQ